MIAIDYRDQRPLYEQVRDAYRRQILAGLLEPGTEMPSVRSLAAQLSVNPNTIQRAYHALEADGCICSVKGKGSFVSYNPEASQARKNELLAAFDETVQELLSIGVDPETLIERLNGGGNRD